MGVSAVEEAEDYPGGDPIVGLMETGAEGGTVEVGIEETDVDVAVRMDVDAAADFHGETVDGGGVATNAAGGGVGARSTEKGFGKRSQAPAILRTVEVTRAVMIAVEDIFGAVDGLEIVAAVADELQPGFEVVTKRAESAEHVGVSAGAAAKA